MAWTDKLWQDIYDRAQADSASGGLVDIANAFNVFGVAQSTQMPYVYAFPDFASTEEAFRAEGINVILDIHTYHEREAPSSGDTLSTCALLLERIEGDYMTASGATPSYGFNRWTPTLSGTGWAASPLVMTGPHRPEHETGVYHFVTTFETLVSRRKPGA